MPKRIIRLNEEQFNSLVSESVKQALQELTYRQAALAHGANYNAQQDYIANRNQNARIKMKNAEGLSIPALTQAIKSNFPNLMLEFVEHNDKTNRSYPVDFTFNEVKYIDKERFVLEGYLDMPSSIPSGNGTIEYQFNTQTFYRVSYSDKTTRSRKIHGLVSHNIETANKLLAFITNYLYSTEDYENNVNVNGSTLSKKR